MILSFSITEIILSIVLVLILIVVIYRLLKNLIISKNQAHYFNVFCNYGDVIKSNDEIFDFYVFTKKGRVKIKVLYVPKNATLVVNSRNYWELRYGGKNSIGTPPKFVKLIKNMEILMDSLEEYDDDIKIVVVASKPKNIQKQLNENERTTVTPDMDVYGVHIVNAITLNKDLDLLIGEEEYNI